MGNGVTRYNDNNYGDRQRQQRPTMTDDNEDGNGATGDEVDDDGDDDDCGNGLRRWRRDWRRRDGIRG